MRRNPIWVLVLLWVITAAALLYLSLTFSNKINGLNESVQEQKKVGVISGVDGRDGVDSISTNTIEQIPIKGDTGAKGDKGDTGSQGIQGEKGETGDRGFPEEKTRQVEPCWIIQDLLVGKRFVGTLDCSPLEESL